MRDDQRGPNRLLYRALRVLAGAMTLISALVISFACVAALFGDQELLIELVDEDVDALVLNTPTIVAIIATNILAVSTMCLLFVSMNRFLKQAESGELLVDAARNALTRLGVAMCLLYVTMMSLALLIPMLGIPGFWADYGPLLLLYIFDLDILMLLIGVVLLALGEALREGQAAKEEAKQYV